MSNQDYDPTRRSQAPTEQIPHSGVHHGEQPVTEFDKTPLRDAPIPHELPQGVTTGHLPEDMRPEAPRSRRNLLIGAGTIASLVAAGGLWLGLGDHGSANKKGPDPTQPVATAPASPSAEQSGSATSGGKTPENTLFPSSVEQSNLYKELSPTQQAEVDRYHAMSLNEFEQLPLEQRLAYAQFVYDIYEPGAMAQLQKDESRVLPAPNTLSEQNTGQEIVNNDDIKRSVAFWVLSKGGETSSLNEKNRLDAQKMEALRSRFVSPSEVKGNNTDTSVYSQAIETLQSATSLMAGSGAGYDYYIATAMKESPTITGPTEEPTKYVHVLYNGETTQYMYVYNTFTDIQGKQRSQWTIAAHEDASSPFWIKDETLPNLH